MGAVGGVEIVVLFSYLFFALFIYLLIITIFSDCILLIYYVKIYVNGICQFKMVKTIKG